MALNGVIGKYELLAIVVGIVAALTALQQGLSVVKTVSVALLATAIVGGIIAAFEQYRKTGSTPGPVVSFGTVLNFVIVALLATYPALLGTITFYTVIAWLIGFFLLIEEEVAGVPATALAEDILKGLPKK